jgi:hypothetical protein
VGHQSIHLGVAQIQANHVFKHVACDTKPRAFVLVGHPVGINVPLGAFGSIVNDAHDVALGDKCLIAHHLTGCFILWRGGGSNVGFANVLEKPLESLVVLSANDRTTLTKIHIVPLDRFGGVGSWDEIEA